MKHLLPLTLAATQLLLLLLLLLLFCQVGCVRADPAIRSGSPSTSMASATSVTIAVSASSGDIVFVWSSQGNTTIPSISHSLSNLGSFTRVGGATAGPSSGSGTESLFWALASGSVSGNVTVNSNAAVSTMRAATCSISGLLTTAPIGNFGQAVGTAGASTTAGTAGSFGAGFAINGSTGTTNTNFTAVSFPGSPAGYMGALSTVSFASSATINPYSSFSGSGTTEYAVELKVAATNTRRRISQSVII